MFVRPGSIVMGLVKEIGLVNRTDSLVILGSVKEDLLFLIFDSVLIDCPLTVLILYTIQKRVW